MFNRDFRDRGGHQGHAVLEQIRPVEDADAAAAALAVAAVEGPQVDGRAVAEVEVVEGRGGRVDEDAAAAADVGGFDVGEATGEGEAC